MVEASRRSTSLAPEPGSFRDWDGRVFGGDGRILRALSPDGFADWEALAASRLFERFRESGELVETAPARDEVLLEVQALDPEGGWIAVLDHERLPYVSYPYEWSFSMLRDAAALQLRLLSAALEEDLMLKDATPYNVQWRGAQPVFVDVGSFERARDGEPWPGYRQFCMLYLFPLMLQAYKGVAFQPWLRGSLEGIDPGTFRALFGRRDAVRPGMLRHVFLHASLERRYAHRAAEVRSDLQEAGFDRRMIAASVAGMTSLLAKLRPSERDSTWQDYDTTCSYDERETAAKEAFVRRAVGLQRRQLVWDLGCNEGRYSRIAAENADFVVAIDSDDAVVDALYRSLSAEGNRVILPLVVDLANPSPPLGWAGVERRSLVGRGRPDLTLCLALVHHLSISRNVPLREVVRWLRELDSEVVVELPHRGDPMVQRLLGSKREHAHPDYNRGSFEDALRSLFRVVDSLELASGTRTLYHAAPA